MSGYPVAPMRSLLEVSPKAKQFGSDAEIWCLNLDQIESHSGKVLSRLMVKGEGVGPSTFAFAKGTVLYSKLRPYLNKVVIADADGVATTELVPLRCDASKVIPDYLAHFLRSPIFLAFATNVVAGAKMPRMVMSEFWAYPVPLPLLEEQRRIAAILDQVEALRTQRRDALAQLDSLTQSLFLDMFGDPVVNPKTWPVRALDEVTTKVTDGEHLNPVFSDAGMPIVMAGNVLDDRIDLKAAKRVETQLGQQFRKKCGPELGDLLIVGRGATIGRLCRVNVEDTFCLMGSVILVKPDRSLLDERFLSGMLAFPSMRAKLYKSSGSSAQQAIYLKDVKKLRCPLPPLALQRTFASRIQTIEALKVTHRAALAELDMLFASLQQRAFSGELTQSTSPVQVLHTDFSELCKLDAGKGLEALIYVARRMPEHHFYKSLKALYFADKHQLEHQGRLIYGETHCALPMGPVPQAAYDAAKVLSGELLVSAFDDEALRASLRRTDRALIPLRDADPEKLSAEERASLDWAIRYVAPMSFDQVKTASHDSAYERTPRNMPIQLEHIVEMLPDAAKRKFFPAPG